MSAPINSQRQYTAFDSVLDRLLNVVTVMAVIADGVSNVCDALEHNTPASDGPPAAQQDGPSGREFVGEVRPVLKINRAEVLSARNKGLLESDQDHSSQQRAAGEVEQ